MLKSGNNLVQVINKYKAEDIEKECYGEDLSVPEQMIAKTEDYQQAMDVLTMLKRKREIKWKKLKLKG